MHPQLYELRIEICNENRHGQGNLLYYAVATVPQLYMRVPRPYCHHFYAYILYICYIKYMLYL